MAGDLTWEFILDWDNDGSLEAGEEEQDHLRQVTIDRGRQGLFVTAGGGEAKMGKMQAGLLTATMDNGDQRYDPWYTSSPLYPNVKPGRLTRLRCTYGTVTYDMFKGYLDEPDSRGHRHDKVATFACSDGWRFLSERPVKELALQEDQWTDDIIGALLTAADWPAELGSELADGSQIVPFFWGGGITAYDLLHEIAEAEFGLIYIPGDGKIHFNSRHSTYNQAVATIITDDEVAGDPIVDSPWDSIRNEVIIVARPLTEQSVAAEVWQLRDTPQVNAGQTLVLWAEIMDSFNRASPAKGTRMNETTDWTANTSPDGGGSDVSSSFTVTHTAYGSLVKISITNNLAYAAYIDFMRIWAVNPIEMLASSESEESDAASIADYNKRVFRVDQNPWIQDSLHAKAYAEWIASWASDPHPSILLTLQQRPDLQLGLDIGDIITYTSAKLGIDDNFRIGRIRHRTGRTMQELFTEIVLEPFEAAANFWLLGTVGRSEIGETTFVAF